MTHNYVLVEAAALTHRKLGGTASRELVTTLVLPIELVWVDENVHRASVSAYLAGIRGRASLVDWVSFEVMRRHGVKTAFAFDRDFAAAGFELIP